MSELILVALLLGQASPQNIPPSQRSARADLAGTSTYRIKHLEMAEVRALARAACGGSLTVCHWTVRGNELDLRADVSVHLRFAADLRERDVPQQTFELMLLIADRGGERPDDLPAHAREVLDDLGRVLPYTGFRLLDTGEIRAAGRGSLELARAPGYRVQIEFDGDPGSGEPLRVDRFKLFHREVGPDDGKGDRQKRKKKEERTLLSNSFSIDVGETVVVGTSSLHGDDEALVVLLTAKPSQTTQGGESR